MKLVEIYNIFESGDTRADSIAWRLVGNIFVGDFVESGVPYRVRLVHVDSRLLNGSSLSNKRIYNIQFGINDGSNTNITTNMTDIGNSIRVLGIVQSESIIKLNKQIIKPDIISVTISLDPNDNNEKQIRSRTNLYTRFLRSNGVKYGYKYMYPDIKVGSELIIAAAKSEITPDEIHSFTNLMISRGK